jgi:hypothetical protein
MSSTNHDTLELNYELEEEIHAAVGRETGIFQVTHQRDSSALDHTSDTEEDWTRRANRATRRTARIDRAEAHGSDSDGDPVPQERDPASIGDLRRQIQLENAQGEVPEADRAIFEEYFGDRFRRPTSPTGRGWQNRARIAAGARIAIERYGPSSHAIRNTSLLEPMIVPAAPVTGLCELDRARQRRLRQEAARNEYVRRCNQELRTYNRARAAQLELERIADECEDALRAHCRLSDLDVMRSELNARAMAFKAEDPTGFDKWADHIAVAHGCSASKSRQHQIIQWYTRGVPARLVRQVRRVEAYYTTEQYLNVKLQQAQSRFGACEVPPTVYLQEDDDMWAGSTWAGGIKKVFFGYDPVASLNGFQAYVPKGEGAAMLKHFGNNFAARKVRLQHASAQHFPVLAGMMNSFVRSAFDVLSAAEHVPRGIRTPLVEYLNNPLQYQPEGENGGSDGNESDGSEVATIVSEMLAAANVAGRIVRLRLRGRERTTQHAPGGVLNGGEEGVGGEVPADGENDSGSASMDEGGSP